MPVWQCFPNHQRASCVTEALLQAPTVDNGSACSASCNCCELWTKRWCKEPAGRHMQSVSLTYPRLAIFKQ